MAKRRYSQTSVTVWLDPEDVRRLDDMRGRIQSRSGWATKQIRKLVNLEKGDGSRNGRGRRPNADGPARPRAPAHAAHPSAGHFGKQTGILDSRIVETAILRLRSSRYTRPTQPILSVRELAEAVQWAREGTDLPWLARHFGCSSSELGREMAAVEQELKRWSA